MNRAKSLGVTLIVVVLFFLIFSEAAYASVDVARFDQAAYVYYIGPGTLTLIWQLLLGLVVGGVTVITIYRVRVKTFLNKLFGKRQHDDEQQREDNQGGG